MSIERTAPDDHAFRFHIGPRPGRWLNDPNGPIAWEGRYHLFHQPSWGHAVSDDLVHWTILEDALPPTPGGPDRGGAWSGGTVVHDGRVHAIYTGVDETTTEQVVCVAVSDGDLTSWHKWPEPVISGPPAGMTPLGFRDPYVWRAGERWLGILGAGEPGIGQALLYSSPDLRHWTYLGPFFERASDPADPDFSGEMWECPFLVPVDGRSVLGASVWWQGRTFHSVAFVGDVAADRFTPSAMSRLDYGPDLYAPTAMIDPAGRCLLWGWSWEAHDAATSPFGHGGALSVPRRLTVAGDTLRVDPIEELALLRGPRLADLEVDLAADRSQTISADSGTVFDLDVTVPAGLAVRLEVEVLASPDGSLRTIAFLDPGAGTVGLDLGRSTHPAIDRPAIYQAPVDPGGADRTMRILVDGSILEAFIDGRALTARIPGIPDGPLAVRVVAAGNVGGVRARLWSVTERAIRSGP